jgi:hypothetical protein
MTDPQHSSVYVDPQNENESSRFVRNLRSNVESDLIEITEDKLENILLKHIKQLNIKDSWVSPLSLFVAVAAAKTTATFNDALGLKAAVWEAIFVLVGVGSVCWLARNLYLIASNWNKSTLDSLMNRIKDSQDGGES